MFQRRSLNLLFACALILGSVNVSAQARTTSIADFERRISLVDGAVARAIYAYRETVSVVGVDQSRLRVTPSVVGSCEYAAVAALVAASVDGGTVTIPPGDCTWTTMLTSPKGITLQGSGQGVTIIRDNVTKDGTSISKLITFDVDAPHAFRITAMTIVGVAVDKGTFNQGHIALAGSSKNFRVDHITFTSPQTAAIRFDGDLWGVIDHNTMNVASGDGNKLFVQAGHTEWGGSNYGDGSWAEALYLGTEKAVYIEDNTLNADPGTDIFVGNVMDGVDGARVVFRFNDLSRANTTAHGLDTSGRRRSIRSQEIYANDYTFPAAMSPAFISWFRGGTGMHFLSTITAAGGINGVAAITNQRDSDSFAPWGECDGSSGYDENTSGQTGYRCVDQPGAGTSNDLAGVAVPPVAWVGNILDPVYVFKNTLGGAPQNCGNFPCASAGHVVMNRDVFFGLEVFDGTEGVGSGVLASRPATCTTGVAYWATDQGSWNAGTNANYTGQGRLYKCTATNTWTLWYTPYTYPHPLATP